MKRKFELILTLEDENDEFPTEVDLNAMINSQLYDDGYAVTAEIKMSQDQS